MIGWRHEGGNQMACETKEVLKEAFREVTLSLTGVFDAFDANPEMVQAAADALGKVYRARLRQGEPSGGGRRKSPMEGLLDDIGRVSLPSACSCSHRK